MLREDKLFELALGAGQAESVALRAFVRQCLVRRYPAFRDQNAEAGAAESLLAARAVAPVEGPRNLIVFDIPSLIARRELRKAAILPPAAMEPLIRYDARQSAVANLDLLRNVQEALRCAAPVFVFDGQHAFALLTLGAEAPIRLDLPAFPGPAPGAGAHEVLIVNHAPDRRTLRLLMPLLAERRSVAVLEAGGDTPDARIHLHIGHPASEGEALRIVDSYAQARPVLHFDESSREQPHASMRLEHHISGIRVTRLRDAPAVVANLLSDAAMADLFVRNGLRIAHQFNATIEEILFGGLA